MALKNRINGFAVQDILNHAIFCKQCKPLSALKRKNSKKKSKSSLRPKSTTLRDGRCIRQIFEEQKAKSQFTKRFKIADKSYVLI